MTGKTASRWSASFRCAFGGTAIAASSTAAGREPGLYSDFSPNPLGSHQLVLAFAGSAKRALDVGAAEGALAERLAARGAEVVCIEIDPTRAAAARKKGFRVAETNIERGPIDELGKFDLIVCADVLEHMVDAAGALSKLRASLAPGGRLVASIPNVAFYGVRLRLLFGRFDYTSDGILDRTHLKFFTHATVHSLFRQAGFTILRETFSIAPPTSAFPSLVRGWYALTARKRAGPAIHKALSAVPGVFATQFVIEAKAAEGAATLSDG